MRALLLLAVLSAVGCREKPRATAEQPVVPAVADAEPDALAAALDELVDGSSDAPPLKGDVTLAKIEFKPKEAFAKLDLSAQRWRFARCYESPGDVTINVRVGEGGETIESTGNPCVAAAAKQLTFPEPAGGFASVDLTLHFSAR